MVVLVQRLLYFPGALHSGRKSDEVAFAKGDGRAVDGGDHALAFQDVSDFLFEKVLLEYRVFFRPGRPLRNAQRFQAGGFGMMFDDDAIHDYPSLQFECADPHRLEIGVRRCENRRHGTSNDAA